MSDYDYDDYDTGNLTDALTRPSTLIILTISTFALIFTVLLWKDDYFYGMFDSSTNEFQGADWSWQLGKTAKDTLAEDNILANERSAGDMPEVKQEKFQEVDQSYKGGAAPAADQAKKVPVAKSM